MRSQKRSAITPRLGALQWVGPVLVGIATMTLIFAQEPLFTHPAATGSGSMSPILPGYFDFLVLLFYSPFLVGLVASLIGAFRAIAAARHRSGFRSLMDLGAPRRGLVRHQTRLGLVHGVIAAPTGAALGGGIAQAMEGFGGAFQSNTMWTLLTIVGLSIASTTLAYWFVGLWITGGTGRTLSAHDVDAAMGVTSGPAPKSRGRRFAVPLGLMAFVVVSALVTPRLTTASTVPSRLATAWLFAYMLVLSFGLPVVVVWVGAKAAAWLSRLAGRALLHGGNAARIAGDGLTRPTPARAVAIGAVGLVLGGTLMIGVIFNATGARNDAVAAVTPRLIISTAELPNRDVITDQTAAAPGWEKQGLDPELLAALQADDRFVIVPAGILTARVDSVDRPDGADFSTAPYLTINPADLERVSAGSSRALYFGGAAAMGGGPNPARLTVDGTSAEVAAPRVGGPFSALPRDWAESAFGSGVTSAALLYDGAAGDAHAAMADYDVTGLYVQDLGGPGTGSGSGALSRTGVLMVSGTLLILAVGLVVALSLGVQKMRGHDYATISALGASRNALRWGTAIESAVVTASGSALGMMLGGAWGLWLGVSGNNVPWHLARTGITFDIDHAPWGTVTLLALVSIATAAIVSVIARARVERLTPAEQLREAVREGAL
ncbi:MAG: hypothetical protein HGA51_02200 [Demequinaceae bacterium]|nr:hypothetical protein [Demequinaceae bacterium]